MPPQRRCSSQTEPAYSLGLRPSPVHGLWPVAVQPYVALVCRLNDRHPWNPCKRMDYYTFTTLEALRNVLYKSTTTTTITTTTVLPLLLLLNFTYTLAWPNLD